MKVRYGASAAAGARGGRGVGGADREGLQQMRGHGRKKLWEREQAVELSRLVLGFVRQHKRLPDAGDRGFWHLCHNLFKGAFTHRQVQAKARHLHLRFCGRAANSPRAVDRQILQIWTHILQFISPSASASECPSSPPPTQVNEMKGARVNPGVNRMGGHPSANPGVGPAKKGGNASGAAPAAARQEPQEATSTCSTAYVDDYEEEFNGHGDFQGNAARGSSGSDDDDFIHNSALLHHLTVADLAAAVKTLAEIVALGARV